MKKKITIKSATSLRNNQMLVIPDEITKQVDDWIHSPTTQELPTLPIQTNTEELAAQDLSSIHTKTVRLNINIPIELHKNLKRMCIEKGKTITKTTIDLIKKELSM
jgi:hypothetical protein